MQSRARNCKDEKRTTAQNDDDHSLFDRLLDDISKEYCFEIEKTVNDCFGRLSKLYRSGLNSNHTSISDTIKRSVAIQCGERFKHSDPTKQVENPVNLANCGKNIEESNNEAESLQIDNIFDSIANYFNKVENKNTNSPETQTSLQNNLPQPILTTTDTLPVIQSINRTADNTSKGDCNIASKRQRLDLEHTPLEIQEPIPLRITSNSKNNASLNGEVTSNSNHHNAPAAKPVLIDLTKERKRTPSRNKSKKTKKQTTEILYAASPFQFQSQNEMFRECKISVIRNECYKEEPFQPAVCLSPSKCLPDITHKEVSQYLPPLPDGPDLSIERNGDFVVLIWSVKNIRVCTKIRCYYIYVYQENDENSFRPEYKWKKVGRVEAIPCPVAVTLSQFSPGKKYYFAVLATDIHDRNGPFSKTVSITL